VVWLSVLNSIIGAFGGVNGLLYPLFYILWGLVPDGFDDRLGLAVSKIYARFLAVHPFIDFLSFESDKPPDLVVRNTAGRRHRVKRLTLYV